MKMRAALLATAMLMASASSANAAVLVLNYDVTPASGGNYHYNFNLTLNNADGTWAPGQQFDWITFGDRSGDFLPSGFCPTGTCGSGQFFNFSSTDPNAKLEFSTGGHQGPTIAYGTNVVLPGWQPSGVGSTLSWSGDSSTFLGAGQLYFSTLVVTPNTSRSDYQLAIQTNAAVPEPTTWAMMLAGFGMIGFAMRRKARQTQAIRFAF